MRCEDKGHNSNGAGKVQCILDNLKPAISGMNKSGGIPLLMMLLFITVSSANAMPDIIYERDINISLAKSVLNDINESYFDGLEYIRFVDDFHPTYGDDDGYYNAARYVFLTRSQNGYKQVLSYGQHIYIYQTEENDYNTIMCVLLHELGHHQTVSTMRSGIYDYSNVELEQMADAFRDSVYGGECE